MIAGRTKAKAAERTREVKNAALKTGTFADAAAFAELVLLTVSGSVAVDVLHSVLRQVSGIVVIDTTNPLSFPEGKPMQLPVANSDSVAEQLERVVPDARIGKALNMMNSRVMIEPAMLHGEHVACIAGND